MINEHNITSTTDNSTSPLVTIVITVYNNPLNELEECIKSVVNQSYSPIEILLVDDGSNIAYQAKLKKLLLSYSQIVYLRKANGGTSSARNHGVIHSKSNFISFLDPDDTYHRNKIHIQTNLLLKNQDVHLVAGGSLTNTLKDGSLKTEIKMPIPVNGNFFPLILRGLLGIHGTPNYLFKKSAIIRVGFFDEELNVNEDKDLLYRITKEFNLTTHQDIVCTVNKTNTSTSNNLNKKMLESKLVFMKKILDDEEISDLSIKANYSYRYIMLKLVLSSNYKDFKNSLKNTHIRVLVGLGLKSTIKSIILRLLFSHSGPIIYKIFRKSIK